MRVIVESPFAGGFQNVKYSRECLRDCINRGESPFASHLLYTQKGVLDDRIQVERERGIATANAWLEVADYVVVYGDLGITEGMEKGIAKAIKAGKPVQFRWLRSGLSDTDFRTFQNALTRIADASDKDERTHP